MLQTLNDVKDIIIDIINESPWKKWLMIIFSMHFRNTWTSYLYFYLAMNSGGAFQVVLVLKNTLAKAGDIRDAGSISGLGRSSGGRHGNPLQYSCLENPMDRRAWQATVHRVAQSRTQLKRLNTHTVNSIISLWLLSLQKTLLHKHKTLEMQAGFSVLLWLSQDIMPWL